MTTVDDSKRFLANLMSDIAAKITSGKLKSTETPEFYFRTSICAHMTEALAANNYDMPQHIASTIAAKLSVNLSGLGTSYIPHKDFLDKLVKDSSVIIVDTYCVYSRVFGDKLAIDMVRDFKIFID
jgi:hypothetical protein